LVGWIAHHTPTRSPNPIDLFDWLDRISRQTSIALFRMPMSTWFFTYWILCYIIIIIMLIKPPVTLHRVCTDNWNKRLSTLNVEIMNDDWIKNTRQGTNELAGSVSHQGGLHPCRIPYTKSVVSIDNSSAQINIWANLDVYGHFSLPFEKQPSYKREVAHHKIKHKHIRQDESYIPPTKEQMSKNRKLDYFPFVVINRGTPEWDADMEVLFNKLRLEESCRYVDDQVANDRGNLQYNSGYTGTGQPQSKDPADNSIPKPQSFANNKDPLTAESFGTLSQIMTYLISKYPGIAELFLIPPELQQMAVARQLQFGEHLYPGNFYDATTKSANCVMPGLIYYGSMKTPLPLHFHCDKRNDHLPGFNLQINCNCLCIASDNDELGKMDASSRSSDTGDPGAMRQHAVYRCFITAYHKVDCGRYMEKIEWMGNLIDALNPIIDHALLTFPWKCSLDGIKEHLLDRITEDVIRRGIPIMELEQVYTKHLLFGHICECIHMLHPHINDGKGLLYQALELAYCFCGTSTPVCFHEVVRHWVHNQTPIAGSLIQAFFETAKEITSTHSTNSTQEGLPGRFAVRPPHSSPASLIVIEEGLRLILLRLPIWNKYKIRPKNATHHLFQICKFVEKCLPNIGMLYAQHFVQILVRLYIITQPILAQSAFIVEGTATWERLVDKLAESTGMLHPAAKQLLRDKGRLDQFLRSISARHNLPTDTMEQLLCKVLTAEDRGEPGSLAAASQTRAASVQLSTIRSIKSKRGLAQLGSTRASFSRTKQAATALPACKTYVP
jgi:hypothetical protein